MHSGKNRSESFAVRRGDRADQGVNVGADRTKLRMSTNSSRGNSKAFLAGTSAGAYGGCMCIWQVVKIGIRHRYVHETRVLALKA